MSGGACAVAAVGVLLLVAVAAQGYDDYRIGAGIYDVTGPSAEVGFMGMGQFGQRGHGIHFRLRSRAFVVEDVASGQRLAFVSNDLCMTYGGMVQNVTALLQAKYGDLYTEKNVMISGTHTHSGPGGFTYMTLYDLSTLGFHDGNFETVVNGIYNAIVMAHENLSSGGRILINTGTLLGTNINRSAYSYYKNPPEEIAKYEHDVDKEMTVLRMEDENGNELGMLNWFAVHGTSMNNTNLLVSGDNKGFASYEVELAKNGNSSMPGMGPFVAIFGQSNEGDVTPNTKGAFCDDGSECDARTSTCPNERGMMSSALCHGYGPGEDMFDSTKVIGHNQAEFALNLYESAATTLQGGFGYVHTFVNMENVTVSPSFTSTGVQETTCPAALGDAFAGGTTDGPGDFNFHQGTNDTNPNTLWNDLAWALLSKPTEEQQACHAPKPILLNTGDLSWPAPWTASVVPLQIFRIGQLFIIGVPGEFTTMAGRRLRDTVMNTLQEYGAADENSHVVIAGLSNEYTHYITTFEEYQIQRYEAGSTLFGPHTLAAYQQEFSKLAQALATNQTVPDGPSPPDNSYISWCIAECDRLPDGLPDGVDYGDVYQDAYTSYTVGDTVSVTFWGGNPQNDYFTQDSYLTVDVNDNGTWKTVFVDGHWDTKFIWSVEKVDQNLITIEWDIAEGTPAGTYRITHQGAYKAALGVVEKHYSGVSSSFQVTA